ITQSWFLRFVGRHDESLAVSQRAIELSGDSIFVQLGHGQALAAAGKQAETDEVMQRIFERGEHLYLSYYQVALIYAYAGQKEKALDALERGFEDREGWLIWLGSEPALDLLRAEPRFESLLRKINQPIAASKVTLDTFQQSRTTLSEVEAVIQPAESKRRLPVSLKYALAAIVAIIVAYGLYVIISV
ncbi:MAG TPA: hypothetical protein VK308_13930, partial [Pyrinomonadaceae bacterium]|nr:hypothetical protein [Pyrinomonadaceae bacterium]